MGLTPCWMCKAMAAPILDLNETKAAGTCSPPSEDRSSLRLSSNSFNFFSESSTTLTLRPKIPKKPSRLSFWLE
uniref:Uncharacterized protein n=1 Tax=Rhizophora mucronata TaxID=61149 RepID=A0A2P2J6Q4_RHIMU